MPPLVLFFVLAYAIAWLFFVPLALSATGVGWWRAELSLPLFTVLGTLGPSAAALLTLRITERRWPRLAWRQPAPVLLWSSVAALWLAVGYSVLPVLLLTTGPVSELHWTAFLSPAAFSISTILGGPLFEEPGWRGYALPRLQTQFGPAAGSLLLALLWAGWHLPLFLCPRWSSSGPGVYFVIVAGLSLSMTWLWNRSGGSVVVAIVAHAIFNTTSRWLGPLLGEHPIREWSPVWVIALSGAGAGVALLVATRGRLGAPAGPGVLPQ